MFNVKKKLVIVTCCTALMITGGLMKANYISYGAPDTNNESANSVKEGQLVRVYGNVTKLENNRIRLNNSNTDSIYSEIILNVSEETKLLDAVTGYPMSVDSIADGQLLYAYIGNAVTLSLPPIGNAVLMLGNIPEDYAVPTYNEILKSELMNDGWTKLTMADGSEFIIDKDCIVLPYLTRNIVTVQDLTAHRYVLVWSKAEDTKRAAKVVLFPEDTNNKQNGWSQENDSWFYYQGGQPIISDWYNDKGNWYLFGADGVMVTGWQKVKDDWYYFDTSTGMMITGFLQADGKTYYLNEDGKLLMKSKSFTPDENGALK